MSIAAHPSLFVSLGVAVLILWRLYSRIRRMVGRQKLSSVRPWVTVFLFPVLLAVLLLASLAHPVNALALVAGCGCGAALGAYGLRLTKFEQTAHGLFYTPSAHLGIALSLLLLGRVVYRVAGIYLFAGQVSASPSDFARSPLTLAIFGTLAGYYVAYAIGLLRWRRRAALGSSAAIASEQPDA